MSIVSKLLIPGFGSWSTVSKMPSWGLGGWSLPSVGPGYISSVQVLSSPVLMSQVIASLSEQFEAVSVEVDALEVEASGTDAFESVASDVYNADATSVKITGG